MEEGSGLATWGYWYTVWVGSSSHLSRRSVCLPVHRCNSRSTSWPFKCFVMFRLAKLTLLVSGCSICSFSIKLTSRILNKQVLVYILGNDHVSKWQQVRMCTIILLFYTQHDITSYMQCHKECNAICMSLKLHHYSIADTSLSSAKHSVTCGVAM